MIQFHIRENHARAEMRPIAENRIADVTEMRHLRFVEEDAVLELAGISHHHAVADDHVFAHVTAAADVAVLSDPGRALSTPRLVRRSCRADENRIADERFADQLAQHRRLETELQITRDLLERVPDVLLRSRITSSEPCVRDSRNSAGANIFVTN